jgi:hypothetical protein
VVLNAKQKSVVRPARRGGRESCEGKESGRNLLTEIPDADGSGALAIIVKGRRWVASLSVVVSANSAAMISEAGIQKKIVP